MQHVYDFLRRPFVGYKRYKFASLVLLFGPLGGGKCTNVRFLAADVRLEKKNKVSRAGKLQ